MGESSQPDAHVKNLNHSILQLRLLKKDQTNFVCVSHAQLCPTLFQPMDHSPPGSSLHGISQARILEGTSLAVQGLRLCTPNTGGPGPIPGGKTRSHMLQLRVHMPHLKILHAAMNMEDSDAATKTQWSQINKNNRGDSLVVQWLRLWAPNGGSMGSIPSWGAKIPHAVGPVNKIKQFKIK